MNNKNVLYEIYFRRKKQEREIEMKEKLERNAHSDEHEHIGCLLLIVNLDETLICRQNEDTMQSSCTILSRTSPFETENETESKPRA